MFCSEMNSYLQLVCPLDPRVINKAVRRAMVKKRIDVPEGSPWEKDKDTQFYPDFRRPPSGLINPEDELPTAIRLESMQQSLFAAWADVTQANLGYSRIGLRIILKEIHSDDTLIQLQAVHTMLEQVQIPENVLYLIDLNVVNRLMDLMMHSDPVIREKITFTLTHLANYLTGRKKIVSHPLIFEHLIQMFTKDRKEIRYASALCLKTITRDRCACEIVMKCDKIIESLLKMIKNDHHDIVIFHMNSLRNLSELDPIKPLQANAFQVMRKMMIYHQYRIVQAAMDVMAQLCKNDVGKKLADQYDMTKILQSYLVSPDIEVVISAVSLMQYTTLTTTSLWRVKAFAYELVNRLVTLSLSHNVPVLQRRAMEVLCNLCVSPDIRAEIKSHERRIFKRVHARNHETWDDTREVSTFDLKSGLNYRTMCIETLETIKSDWGDTADTVNVHSVQIRIQETKKRLLNALNFKSYL